MWYSPSTMELLSDSLGGKLMYIPVHTLRMGWMQHTTLKTEVQTLLNMQHEVHVVVAAGQNDAQEAVRGIAILLNASDELKTRFMKRVQKDMVALKESASGARLHWCIPWDDPAGEFSQSYLDMVSILKREVSKEPSTLSLGPFEEWEADNFHVRLGERRKMAGAIQAWFEGLGNESALPVFDSIRDSLPSD